MRLEFARPWVRFPGGAALCFSSDPAVSSFIFVGAEREENLIRNDPDKSEFTINLVCSSCLKYANEMLLGDPRQAEQRTQSFHCPIVIHHALDPAAQALSSLPCLYMHSSTRQPQNASTCRPMRGRGNYMQDNSRFQRDIDWCHRPLSLSLSPLSLYLSIYLYFSQKPFTHNIPGASPPGIISLTDTKLHCWQRNVFRFKLANWIENLPLVCANLAERKE